MKSLFKSYSLPGHNLCKKEIIAVVLRSFQITVVNFCKFRLPFVLLLCSYHPAKISNVATALSTCAD